MTGSPEVITGLLAALAASKEAFDSLHNQEHKWEVDGYGKLEGWFDDANRTVWGLHHRLLKRLFKLGGAPEGVTSDPKEAFTKALIAFQGLHDVCQAIYAAAEADNDYVTTDKLAEVQACIESCMVKCEKKLRQIETLGTEFLAEQM